ncbi:hypothetical protein MtrunA17_Chr1g0167391 [Medicago truncatula]|uniref:Uncharacterized protein n=1 Tax=Medicago truncatula TaxID=3880 RepID=A0A396JPG8_MEDTR|nr:hypothetical protein MtrunA17_Chr1g0167391 [Medicago truncatula]
MFGGMLKMLHTFMSSPYESSVEYNSKGAWSIRRYNIHHPNIFVFKSSCK